MFDLSIITINYNNASGLKQTVNSVVNQSNKDFEYIIIDGNSTDGSKPIIDSLEFENLKQIEKVENNEDIEATHTKPTRNFMWISLDKLN